MPDQPSSALKEIFNAARFRQIATLIAAIEPRFDRQRFIRDTTTDLEPLSLLQRMRRGTHALRAALPGDYPATLAVLRELAPKLQGDFAGLMLPDYVGAHGQEHFGESMKALHFLTRFSSGEFAIREFLRRDLKRTLAVMERWSRDENEHVRRLASEGSRPRLPWSFRLEALVELPGPTLAILNRLKADPSLYVRKSVGNHLNDISKDHPEWLLSQVGSWDLSHLHTAWIVKRGMRSLVKQGHPGTLRLFRFTARPAVELRDFRLARQRVRLGATLAFDFALQSKSPRTQRLVVDYAVHYVKKNGSTAPKVFKLREVELAPRASLAFARRQRLQDFTTRKHYPGRHRIEILVNGVPAGGGFFLLQPAR